MKQVNELMAVSNAVQNTKKTYLHVNVILTFDVPDKDGECQNIFNLNLPISKNDTNVLSFTHKKLFKKIVEKCKRLNRSVRDLVKISTCSNWDLYEEITNQQSLPRLGHDCKWYFGNGRCDLDMWEEAIIREYHFGTNVDMSHITTEYLENIRAQFPVLRSKSATKVSAH